MSLETTIAALVTASNNLTAAVNGKISQIDQKVNAAALVVPETIKSALDKSVYVDPLDGSDANDGTVLAKAKKTIKAAIDSVPSGGYSYIWVRPSADIELTNDISLNNKVITIRCLDAVPGAPATYGVIRSRAYIAGNGTLGAFGFVLGWRSLLHVFGFKVITGRLGAEHVGRELVNYQGSVMKTGNSNSTVQLESVNVDLNHFPFMHQHTSGSLGFSNLIMRNASFNKLSLTDSAVQTGRQFMLDTFGSYAAPFDLYGVAVSFTGAASWSELITANMANANTNLI